MNEIFSLEKILHFFDTVFFFFIINILFALCNTPLILFLLFVNISQIGTYLPLFLVCLIPMGPSVAALFYCMHKYVLYKDTSTFNNWFLGLKRNFKQALALGLLQLLSVFIVVSNIRIFTTLYPLILPRLLFVFLFCLITLSIPYTYLLVIRFNMSVMAIIKATFTLVFTHPILTICNAMIFLFVLMLFELSPGTTILFISTVYAFCIMISNRHLIKKLEEKAKA